MKYKLMVLAIFVIFMGCQTEMANDPVQIIEKDMDQDLENELSGSYILKVDESLMLWEGSKIIGNSHEGEIKVSEGVINFDEQTGNFIIDMDTMTEIGGSGAVINHLKNEDFFNVDEYPYSFLNIKNIENDLITADLTILDITNEINFMVNFVEVDDELYANTEFTIDRTNWGVIYNSGNFFQNLGDNAIKNDISFALELVFEKA